MITKHDLVVKCFRAQVWLLLMTTSRQHDMGSEHSGVGRLLLAHHFPQEGAAWLLSATVTRELMGSIFR